MRATSGDLVKAIVRIAAAVVAFYALTFLGRASGDRVLVLVLEGAHLDTVRDLAGTGSVPTLEAIVSRGIGGDLGATEEAHSAEAVLASVVGGAGVDPPDSEPATASLWRSLSLRSRPSIVVGATGTEESYGIAGDVVLPGPYAARGFIGSNVGAIVNRNHIERGQLPWPYAVAAPDLGVAIAQVESGAATDWVHVRLPGAPAPGTTGLTRAYALDADALYLTPVYTRYVRLAGREADPYVADDPASVVTSSRAREFLPRHMTDLSRARVATTLALARSRPWELLLYVDRSIAVAEAIEIAARIDPRGHREASATENGFPGVVESAYAEVDSAIAQLTAAAGPGCLLLVVGIHDRPTTRDTVGWYVASSSRGSSTWSRSSTAELAASIRYLLALPASAGARPIPALLAAYPARGRRAPAPATTPAGEVVPLTVSTMRELAAPRIGSEPIDAVATSRP